MLDGDDAFTQGILDQLSAVVDIELGHETGLMSFGGFGADG